MPHQQEELLNGALASLLSEQGVPSTPERREAGRRMDVVAYVDDLRVVLEAETGHHRRQQAIKDADARLRQELTNIVFAVCYPDNATTDNLSHGTLIWTVRTTPGEPQAQWSSGNPAQLAHAVRQAPQSLSGADVAAQILSDGLDAAVQKLSAPTRRSLAKALDLPPTKSSASDEGGGYFVAAKRGMLVVATAMLFHHRLQDHLPEERAEGYDGPWPPATATACAEEAATIHAHSEAWRSILAVDYRPVFQTGRAALAALSSHPDSALAVRNLARVVAQITERVAGLRHDLLGRIFHRVLDTARYDGSFYTSTAAAVLLASLAIREQDADWADPNAVEHLRICDPACGTGTLLLAAAERIRDLRRQAGPVDADDEETLALCLVEDVLWGYDINLTATHMAASTLGMISPTTQFHRMNVHRTLLGIYDGATHLGSLDFLQGSARLPGWPTATQQVEEEEESAPPPSMDLVIMNPPFTRDSLRHDQFTRADELAIKQREKEILKGQPYQAAARLSGSANAFLVLADKQVRDSGGTLAVVLPTVMATNPAAFETRRYLSERFHIDTIVSSHDPERIFFSENTSIGEVLLVCRRWTEEGPKPPTKVVNLARNPSTPIEALDAAMRIEQSAGPNSHAHSDFTVQQVAPERIENGDWYAVNFLSPFLVEAYRSLAKGDNNPFPTQMLGEASKIGPEGRRIRDSYTQSEMPTVSGRRALWHHKTNVTQSLRAETDVYIEPKPALRHLADRYWEQRSRLLLPHRLWLPLARVGAVKLDEPTVGSIWTPCNPHDPAITDALCLYLNSSVGLLALLGGRDNRKPSYPSFSIDSLRRLPIPDFAAVRNDARDFLSSRFKWLQDEALLPFPQMNDDSARRQIDAAVSEALDLDPEWVALIRRALSEEPSVTNRRYRVS